MSIDLDAIEGRAGNHTKGYRSTANEVHDINPVCSYCDRSWPCETAAWESESLALVAEVRRLSGVIADVLYLADQNDKNGDPIWPHEIRYVMTTDDLSGGHPCLGCEVCS